MKKTILISILTFFVLVVSCGSSGHGDVDKVAGNWTGTTPIELPGFGVAQSGTNLTFDKDGRYEMQQVVRTGLGFDITMSVEGEYAVEGNTVKVTMERDGTKINIPRGIFPSDQDYENGLEEMYKDVFGTNSTHVEMLEIVTGNGNEAVLKDAQGTIFHKVEL